MTVVANTSAQRARLAALRERGSVGLLRHCLTIGLELDGRIEERLLQGAVDDVVERHQALRARFDVERDDHVIDDTASLQMQRVLVTGTDEARRLEDARVWAREDALRPFDVSRPPLMRVTLLAVAPRRSVLVLTCDQLATDAWSAALLVDDLVDAADRLLRGRPLRPVEPDQYTHARAKLGEWLDSRDGLAAAARAERSAKPERRLPLDPEPDTDDPDLLATAIATIDRGSAAALHDKTHALRVPESVVAFTALALACGRLAGEDAPTVRTTLAARETSLEERVVGWFSNEAEISTSAAAETVEEKMRAVARALFDALAVQRVPRLRYLRDDGSEPGLSVALVYLPRALSGAAQAEMRVGDVVVRRSAVSVCPSGADVELFVGDDPRSFELGEQEALVLGALSRRVRVGAAQLEEILATWQNAYVALAACDWRRHAWSSLLSDLEPVATSR
jgi:hypothetical protein